MCIIMCVYVYWCMRVSACACVSVGLCSVPCSIINANDKVPHFITSFYLHISHIRTRTYRQSAEAMASEVVKKNELGSVSMA